MENKDEECYDDEELNPIGCVNNVLMAMGKAVKVSSYSAEKAQ